MRYSVSTLAFPGIRVDEVVPICAELGLDGIDLRTDVDGEHIHPDLPAEERRRILDLVHSHGLTVSGLYSYAGRAASVDPDPEIRKSDIALIRQVVDLAVDLDCPLVRVFSGTKDRLPERYARFIETMRSAGEYAAEAGVQLGLETHGELVYDAASAHRVVAGVDLPNIVIIWDPANMQLAGQDPVSEAPDLWSLVRYIQLKDWIKPANVGRQTAVLMGQGEVRLADLIAFIKAQRYDGWICLEYEKKWHAELPAARTGLAHDLAYLRQAFST